MRLKIESTRSKRSWWRHWAVEWTRLFIEAIYIGKPSRYIFEATLDSMHLRDRDRVLMGGDIISTDILGARNAGVRSTLIGTGELGGDGSTIDVQPDYSFDSITDLAFF
jgi:ribonucleotide monophosphatase NagD (HAD superfamily)